MNEQPEWLVVLAVECTKTSRLEVANKIGYSKTVICQVLNGKYKPNNKLRKAVESTFMTNEKTVVQMKQERTMSDKPEWQAVLAAECKKTSQTEVAKMLGYSPSVINQALNDKYQGDLYKLQEMVEGAYMGKTVDCPLIGSMPRHRCIEMQGRPFAVTNPLRVQLFHTCPTCPHNCRTQKEHAA